MGQSTGSIGGGSHKQSGADNPSRNQPEARPGQKMSDQDGTPGRQTKGKPDGGADQGSRSVR